MAEWLKVWLHCSDCSRPVITCRTTALGPRAFIKGVVKPYAYTVNNGACVRLMSCARYGYDA